MLVTRLGYQPGTNNAYITYSYPPTAPIGSSVVAKVDLATDSVLWSRRIDPPAGGKLEITGADFDVASGNVFCVINITPSGAPFSVLSTHIAVDGSSGVVVGSSPYNTTTPTSGSVLPVCLAQHTSLIQGCDSITTYVVDVTLGDGVFNTLVTTNKLDPSGMAGYALDPGNYLNVIVTATPTGLTFGLGGTTLNSTGLYTLDPPSTTVVPIPNPFVTTLFNPNDSYTVTTVPTT